MGCRVHLVLAVAFGPVLFVGGTAGAQGSFEGAVTYQLPSTTGAPVKLVYQKKGTKIRMDVSGGSMSDAQSAVIFDRTTRLVTAMVTEAHMYVVEPLDSVQKGQGGAPAIKSLGTHETIAGTPCENYLVSTEDHQETVCAAHGMGDYFLPQQGAKLGFGSVTLPNGFFPLKVSSVESGKPTVVMIATAVERRVVDPSIFVVPADYKQIDAKALTGATPAAPQ